VIGLAARLGVRGGQYLLFVGVQAQFSLYFLTWKIETGMIESQPPNTMTSVMIVFVIKKNFRGYDQL
jgi:hypothetical protein